MLNKHSLLRHLFDLGAIKRGTFQLKSGRTSDVYCDMRLAALEPNCLALAVDGINNLLGYSYDSIGVMEGAGSCVLLGALLQHLGDTSGFVIRKKPKDHGTLQMIEGVPGEHIILLDDVATSGESLVHAIKNMPKPPLIAIVLIDREEGAKEAIKPFGVELKSILTLGDIREFLKASAYAMVENRTAGAKKGPL